MEDLKIKQQVRKFYDQVGWQMESDGFYQNARYEDLRPVAAEYIEKCHMRVNRHLIRPGRFLLDAGSGPIQYPAYLTYSKGYQYRVCVDISMQAMKEARKRIGIAGLYIVADVANLPFCAGVMDGIVSLHTLHHLPLAEQKKAYIEFQRVLEKGKKAVIINGWTESRLMKRWHWFENLMEKAGIFVYKLRQKRSQSQSVPNSNKLNRSTSSTPTDSSSTIREEKPTGTFIEKLDANWLRNELSDQDLKIFVWRSVSVRFMRAVFHPILAGKLLLRILFRLEERWPEYFGENGQYPLIVFGKPVKQTK